MVCHAESRLDRRAERLRRIGGPFLLPLEAVSSSHSKGKGVGLTEEDTQTRMTLLQIPGSCET